MDDSADKTGTISAHRLTQVPSGATLNLNSGKVIHLDDKNRTLSCIDNAGGTVNFNDGTSTVAKPYAPFLTGTGAVNVKGGTWCASSYGKHGFAALTGGTLNLVGGKVRYEDAPDGDDVLISVENTKVTLSGTTVAACTEQERSRGGTAMELNGSSTLSMTGGALYGIKALKVGEGSTATLTNGAVSGKPFTGDRFANQSSATDGQTFENAGMLTVEADMAITGSNNFLKNTGGTATIQCGGMDVDGTMFEIGGGTVNANFDKKLIANTMFKITEGGSFTIDGGEFETKYSGWGDNYGLGTMSDVDGGTLTVTGGTFTAGAVMFDLNGGKANDGTANISSGTFTMGTQNCLFFKLGMVNGRGIANVTGGTFQERTGIRTDDRNDGYFVFGNGELNALRLSGSTTLPTGELKIYLNGSSGSGINLENELNHKFTLLTSSGDNSYYLSAENTQWTTEQKALYKFPAGYVLDYSDSSKRMRLYKKEGH